jgi:hypothetical protein
MTYRSKLRRNFKYQFPIVLVALALMMGTATAAQWNEKLLYTFQDTPDGSAPFGAIVRDKQGNLYGVTQEGGANNCSPFAYCGTVFQLAPPANQGGAWKETVLHVFQGNSKRDGSVPAGGLVMDSQGTLYGTTAYGGTGNCVLIGIKAGCGMVFELSPPLRKGGSWKETVLYSFPTSKQGYLPNGELVFDTAGNLYGATVFGGGRGTSCNAFYQYCGAVFELNPPKTKGGKWTEKVLHAFGGGKDGANPNGGLIFDREGAIYGTAYAGGANPTCQGASTTGCGTVFRLKRSSDGSWKETELHQFMGGTNDTNTPGSGLVWGQNGDLFGTTVGGANSHGDDGAIYRLSPSTTKKGHWDETLLHRFGAGNVPSGPMSPVTFDRAGNLFGAAAFGGEFGAGAIFRLVPKTQMPFSWTFSVVYAFLGAPDGSYPASNLVLDSSGNIYGTTQQSGKTSGDCGNQGCGTVYQVSP